VLGLQAKMDCFAALATADWVFNKPFLMRSYPAISPIFTLRRLVPGALATVGYRRCTTVVITRKH
jgi:hypothetical protein